MFVFYIMATCEWLTSSKSKITSSALLKWVVWKKEYKSGYYTKKITTQKGGFEFRHKDNVGMGVISRDFAERVRPGR